MALADWGAQQNDHSFSRGVSVKNPLAEVLSWRRAVIVTVALPLVISLAVMAYAWPASRIAPRDLPVGIVGTSTASQTAIEALAHSEPGGFDFHLYPDEASARSAIKDREVYGAFVVTPGSLTVLEATAASASVAQLLGTSGQQLAAHATQLAAESAAQSAHGRSARPKAGKQVSDSSVKVSVRTVDVVPTSADDPRGVVFSSALLPLTMCSILIASFISMSSARMPGWRRLVGLVVACAATGFSAYLAAQGILGALPHQHVATWAALSLTMLAISATSAGLITLIGPAGLGVSAALMVFVGNPFSGSTSAPELLPKAVDEIGQWLPPGAGANLLRGTAYFNGNGSGGHIAVLVLWSVLGLAAVTLGRRTPTVADGSSAEAPYRADGTGGESPAASETATLFRRSTPDGYSESLSPALEKNHPHSHARHAASH
ncbi:ABC transporter permease [Streptomyces sp. NPDC002088]|uniref:ABC transporter permease n=1 Tax=Streptomyces sp. NPDC002088 TaxID=3154665 RepID=UPI00331A36A1